MFATTRATTFPLRLTAPTIGVLPESMPPVPPPPRLSQCLFLAKPPTKVFDFDDAAELINVFHERCSDLMAHEPSGLVGTKAHIALDLQRAHALLAGQHQMNDTEPVAKRLICVLEDRPGNVGEPISGVRGALIALPMPWHC